MAQKGTTGENTTVHRIKAQDGSTKKTTSRTPAKTKTSTKKPTGTRPRKVGYFRGAWRELKLVRWPTRSATWSMTLAVLLFTLLFAVLVFMLDAGFNWLFEQILKK